MYRIVPTAILIAAILGCTGTAVPTEPPERGRSGKVVRSQPDEAPRRRGRGGSDTARTKVIDIDFEGTPRTYRVMGPDDAKGPLPVVFMFHGGGEGNTGRKGEHAFATQRGKNRLFVFPDGLGGHWRLRGEGGSKPDTDPMVDVRFVDAIIDDLDKRFDIDRSKVYAAGFSNGGMLVWELACSNPEPFAGFAAVAASMTVRTLENCKPKVTRPFLYVHGTRDPRFDGGITAPGVVEGGIMLSGHDATLQAAAEQMYLCDGIEQVETVDDCATDGYRVHRHRLTGCKRDHPLVYLEVEGMKHSWPRLNKTGVCTDINTSALALQLWGQAD